MLKGTLANEVGTTFKVSRANGTGIQTRRQPPMRSISRLHLSTALHFPFQIHSDRRSSFWMIRLAVCVDVSSVASDTLDLAYQVSHSPPWRLEWLTPWIQNVESLRGVNKYPQIRVSALLLTIWCLVVRTLVS